MSKAKEVVAAIFEGASTGASSLVGVVGTPAGARALRIGSGIAGLVAQLIRTLGVDDARDVIAAAVQRQRATGITAEKLAADDAVISARIRAMYPPDE